MQKIYQARSRGLGAAQDELKQMVADKRQLEVEVEDMEARLKMLEVAKAASELNIDNSRLARTKELLAEIETRIEVDAQLINAEDIVLDEIPLEEPAEKASILDRITDYETAKDNSETFVGYED
jgi:replicative superfamily II helicase